MKSNHKVKNHFTTLINKISGKNIVKPNDLNPKETSIVPNNKFFNNIKIESDDINKFVKRKEFLDEIDGNVELLQKLSVERLKQLAEYYDKIIEENKIKISKLS